MVRFISIFDKTTDMRKLVLSICSVVYSLIVIAQSSKGNLSIRIINEQQAPLENATIELLRSKDSSLARTAITDKNGAADIETMARVAQHLYQLPRIP